MLTAHGPYASWAGWLDAFGRGEDPPSRHLVAVDDGLGPQMQERLLLRLKVAFESRAQLWGDTLRRHLASGTLREPGELGPLLVAARGRLQPLRLLAADQRLPEPVRASLRAALHEMVAGAQDSLENSVRRAPQGAERMLAVVRENGLLAAIDPPTLPPARREQGQHSPAGRRVIL